MVPFIKLVCTLNFPIPWRNETGTLSIIPKRIEFGLITHLLDEFLCDSNARFNLSWGLQTINPKKTETSGRVKKLFMGFGI